MNEPIAKARDSEMYAGGEGAATNGSGPGQRRLLHAGEGAALGVATWVLLFMLGFPWVLHIGGLDGVLPCAIVGAAFGSLGRRAVPMTIVGLLSLLLLIIAYTPVIIAPASHFIRRDALPQHADAVMVLSAGVNDDGTISPTAMDQLIKGIELVERGIAPVLLLSREAYIMNGKLLSSRRDQERIVSLMPNGLSKVMVVGVTHSTHDEAVRASALFRQQHWNRVVLVTSPMHTRRACGTFEKAGVTVSCQPSNTRALAIGKLSSPDDRVKAFQLWLYETAGTLRYRQLGWL